MRILNLRVRDDEIPYFEQYAKKYNAECLITKDSFNKINLNLLKNIDAITDSVADTYGPEVYKIMQQHGIKIVSLRCAGFDKLDYQLGKTFGVRFARASSYSPNAISEYSIALTLMLLRNLHTGYMRFHNQDYRLDNLIGNEIRDYTVGVLGTGHIGLAAARAFQGFGGKVVAYDIAPKKEHRKWLTYVDKLDDFLSQVNLLVIYLPLNQSTYHIINHERIELMPRGAIIINVARGEHIQTGALYEALKSGQIGGAALDVYENEAPIYRHDWSTKIINDELYRKLEALPNTIMTPHMAFYTNRAVKNMVKISLENVLQMNVKAQIDNEII